MTTERLLYVNLSGYPVSFNKLDTCINDIAAGALGTFDFINETLKSVEMSQELNYRLELIKSAVGYIIHLASDELLPDSDATEKDYAQFGRVVRRLYDGTPVDVEDVEANQSAGCSKKGGSK